MLSGFANGSNHFLPVGEYVSFLFDLAGMGLNVQGILDWCLQILKELHSVELQLLERSSSLTRSYTATLALYCVGVLRKYHKIFIMSSQNEILQLFDILSKIAYKLKPSLGTSSGSVQPEGKLDCNSAEWCVLAYLYELSSCCTFVKDAKSRDKFVELKRLFGVGMEPSMSMYGLTDKRFIVDYIANPKKKIDPLITKLLMENPQNQYNLGNLASLNNWGGAIFRLLPHRYKLYLTCIFYLIILCFVCTVCNVLMEVCECNDTDKLNDIAILCCEFTAQCNALSSEWLSALTALCYSGSPGAYHDLLAQVL